MDCCCSIFCPAMAALSFNARADQTRVCPQSPPVAHAPAAKHLALTHLPALGALFFVFRLRGCRWRGRTPWLLFRSTTACWPRRRCGRRSCSWQGSARCLPRPRNTFDSHPRANCCENVCIQVVTETEGAHNPLRAAVRAPRVEADEK